MAADRAASRLMACQSSDGSWQGEVIWCPVITAQVVLAYAIMGRAMPAERGRHILRYFASTRRPDGGWGLHPESQSYLFVTTLVYVAARLLGEAPDSALLRDAVQWLACHEQGLGALPTWGRFWLSLLGLYDRDRMTVCPPELFLLPAWTPLAADRLYCHTRYIYLGMAYLSGVGLRSDLGAIGVALRRELAGFTRSGPLSRHSIATSDLYVPPGRALRLAYDVMATLGPIWRRLPGAAALRRRALARCMGRIRAEQRASNWQALSPVNGILNTLALWAHDRDAPEVEASIAGLEAWCWKDEAQGLRYAGARSTTWDTAFALQALVESALVPDECVAAIRSGYTALASLQVPLAVAVPASIDSKDLTRRTCEGHGGPRSSGAAARSREETNLRDPPWPSHDLRVENLLAANRHLSSGPDPTSDTAPIDFDEGRQDPVGGWCFGEPAHRWPVSDCTAEALSALLLCHRVPGLVPPDRRVAPGRLTEAFRFLLARQNSDGGFATYERRRGGKRLERLNPSEMFGQCMTERSYIECTSSAIRALRYVVELSPGAMLAHEQTACADAMARARDFLLGQQRPDGAWPGFWGINFIYATGFAVAALRDTGLPAEHSAVQRAVNWLLSVQQPDGGWGEHFSGCLTGSYVPNAGSLVIMTSWAVLALLRATNSVTPPIQRGVEWLVSRQLPDGDWPRDSVNGVFFGTAMLDYRLYNTYFPTWALNLARATDCFVVTTRTDFPDKAMLGAAHTNRLTRSPRNRIRPLVAIRALRNLGRSQGKDLTQGVAFLRATEGQSARRAFDRFRATALGRDVLIQRISLRDQLVNRDSLAAAPTGSLGRAYLDFMERENISVPSLLDLATSDPAPPMTTEDWLFAERCHVMHDLWHVVTGYGPDNLGEVCILAVRSAQMRHVGVWLLCLFGMLKVAGELGGRQVRAAVREAYARGRRATWLYGVDWEAMLTEPLDVVRARLRLAPAKHYPVATA